MIRLVKSNSHGDIAVGKWCCPGYRFAYFLGRKKRKRKKKSNIDDQESLVTFSRLSCLPGWQHIVSDFGFYSSWWIVCVGIVFQLTTDN
jgi:hypothetical protein